MKTSENGIKNLAAALSKFQEEVRNPSNSATNPQFRSKYAPLDVVINTVKPILAKNGLSFLQSTGSEGESISVTTLLIHESGEWIESDPLTLPAYQIKSGGAKEYNAQGAGSSLTYARRYSLSAMLGLSSEDDDDANGQVFGGVDAKSNKTPAGKPAETTPNAREAAKERAAKAAEERKAAQAVKQEPARTPSSDGLPFDEQVAPAPTESAPASTPASGAPAISEQQIKAIGNMMKMLIKKKPNINEETFLAEELAKLGKTALNELEFDECKEIIAAVNKAMREQ